MLGRICRTKNNITENDEKMLSDDIKEIFKDLKENASLDTPIMKHQYELTIPKGTDDYTLMNQMKLVSQKHDFKLTFTQDIRTTVTSNDTYVIILDIDLSEPYSVPEYIFDPKVQGEFKDIIKKRYIN